MTNKTKVALGVGVGMATVVVGGAIYIRTRNRRDILAEDLENYPPSKSYEVEPTHRFPSQFDGRIRWSEPTTS